MELWYQAIGQVVSHGPALASLGPFKIDRHKLWEWRIVKSKGKLYRQNGNQVEVYRHVLRGRYTHIRMS